MLVTIAKNNKKVVIAIENKIKTTEHSNQLHRYREIIERDFKDHTKLYVYLTPENLLPSDEEWIPFNYEIVANLSIHAQDSAPMTKVSEKGLKNSDADIRMDN